MYKISIDSGKDNFVSFEQGDIVKAQKFTGNDIRLTVLEVIKVESDAFYGFLIDGVAPVVGMSFIRIDSSNEDRAGMVIISATGSNTPFIDIAFHQETKSRLGRLDGITDALFPTIGGYGLYSDNVYLKGELVLNSGENVQNEFDSQALDIASRALQIDLDDTNVIVTDQSVLIQANSDGIILKADQTSLNTTNGNVTLNTTAIGVNAGEIILRATQVDLDITDGIVSDNSAAIIVNAGNINLRVEKGDVINQINISTEGIVIAADNIEISGATTFTAGYDPSTKETPIGAQDKADTAESNAAITSQSQVDVLGNSLGDVALLDLIEVAELGTTVIVGGFLKTDLIDVNTLIAENIKTSASGQRVEITSGTQTLNFYDSLDDLILTLDGPNKKIKVLNDGFFEAIGTGLDTSFMGHSRVHTPELDISTSVKVGSNPSTGAGGTLGFTGSVVVSGTSQEQNRVWIDFVYGISTGTTIE